jgi:hypothetical protein
MVNPAPAIVAEFIVTGAVPVDVSVKLCCAEVPTVTLPKFREPGFGVTCGFAATVPIPDNTTTVVAPVGELLLMES